MNRSKTSPTTHGSDTASASLPLHKLGVIGAGVMGKALIQGLLGKGCIQKDQIWAAVKRESSCAEIRESLGITCVTQYAALLPETDALLLCVKPNGLNSVLEKLPSSGLSEKTVIISIVAGASIKRIEGVLGTKNPVIRAMTNTPCLVSQGMTAICTGTHANETHLALAQQIFEAVGACMNLDEIHFNAVTGLSGSGPAYMYLIMEALADGGVRVGLPREAALRIVVQTLLGSAAMVQQSGRHPAALRDDVTTPAGCTIGALLTMEDGKIRSVLARAVEEATRIAGELGST